MSAYWPLVDSLYSYGLMSFAIKIEINDRAKENSVFAIRKLTIKVKINVYE